MNNLDKWEKFLTRQKWKYQEVKSKYGRQLMVKIYSRSKRCHVFISETKVNFAFFSSTGKKMDVPRVKHQTITYCLSFRNDSLHIYRSSKLFGFRNMGINGPKAVYEQIFLMTRQGSSNFPKVQRKFNMIINFYLQLNKIPAEAKILDTLAGSCYPGLKSIGVLSTAYIPAFATSYLRKKDLTLGQFVKKSFKHDSKVIRREMWKIPLDQLSLIYLLRTRMNRGEIENLFNLFARQDCLCTSVQKKDFKMYRYFFSQYSNRKIFKMLSDRGWGGLLTDSIRQLFEHKDKIIAPQQFKNVKDLHDNISLQYKRLQIEDYNFNVSKALKPIDGMKIENTEIVIPKTNHELLDWGQKLNNCIASYHSRFHKGQTIILGIKENDEIKYNVEISRKSVVQFSGKFNEMVPDIDQQPYLRAFADNNLIKLHKGGSNGV